MKTPRVFGIFLLLCAALLLPAHAQEAVHTGADFDAEGFANAGQLWDGTRDTWAVAKDGGRSPSPALTELPGFILSSTASRSPGR